MISLVHNGKVEYITKLEDFKEIVGENVYEALEKFVTQSERELLKQVDELSESLEDEIATSTMYSNENSKLQDENDKLRKQLQYTAEKRR